MLWLVLTGADTPVDVPVRIAHGRCVREFNEDTEVVVELEAGLITTTVNRITIAQAKPERFSVNLHTYEHPEFPGPRGPVDVDPNGTFFSRWATRIPTTTRFPLQVDIVDVRQHRTECSLFFDGHGVATDLYSKTNGDW